MPEPIYTRDGTGYYLSRLDGDTLTVHPTIFGRMQDELAKSIGSETDRAANALAVAGVTANELDARYFRETKVVTDTSLFRRFSETA